MPGSDNQGGGLINCVFILTVGSVIMLMVLSGFSFAMINDVHHMLLDASTYDQYGGKAFRAMDCEAVVCTDVATHTTTVFLPSSTATKTVYLQEDVKATSAE